MSKLNKVITDQTVELTPAEVAVLSSTLLPVVEAIGGGGEGPDLTDYVRKESFQPVSAAVTAMQEVSSKGPAAYNVLTAYSAEGTWLTEHQSLDGKQDKLTFNKNASNELTGIDDMPIAQPDVSDFLTKANADTYYQPLPAAGIGYVTSSTTVITGTNQYALTSAGWTVIQGGGGSQGGIESVSHDTTLSGDGNTTPLGVVSGTTMASALSAGVAEGLTNGTSTSALSDFVTALAGKQAAGNYVSADDLTAYQTTAAMADYYTTAQTSGKDDIAAALLLKADASSLASYLTKSDAQATYQTQLGMASYLTTAKYSTDSGTFMTAVSTGVGLSGNGSVTALGIDTTASLNLSNASAKSAVSAGWANSAKGAHTDYILGSTLDTMSNITALIDTTLMSMTGYNGIERQIDATTDYTTAFGLTDSAYSAVQYVTAHYTDWDAKSTVTVNTANNEISVAATAAGGTASAVSAVSYIVNTTHNNAAAKQLFVVFDDNDLTASLTAVNGKGSLFFVCSAI